MSAGDSARRRAMEHEREAQRQRELARRWAQGAAGEVVVAAAVAPLARFGWQALADRRAGHDTAGNIDLLLVGPGGILVVDAKTWQQAPATDRASGLLSGAVQAVARQADRVRDVVASFGIAPVVVQPVLAFVDHDITDRVDGVQLVGADGLTGLAAALPARLLPTMVEQVVKALTAAFADYEPSSPAVNAGASARDLPALFEAYAVLAEHAAAAGSGPVEEWMTYLDPDQLQVVHRGFDGPARISGAAGTGKTVVGLHRAAYLADRGEGLVLLVTFVRSLAAVQTNLIRRFAAAQAADVHVRTIHQVARDLLDGYAPWVDPAAVRACFDAAWTTVGATRLGRLDPSPAYWRDEVQFVIQGRGLSSLDEYLRAGRRGRVTRLNAADRTAVWNLFEEYQARKTAAGLHDFADLLHLALHHVQQHPVTGRYRAVILDEAQDASLVGLRLLHALVGDRPDGLLLIGDDAQTIYPGGYRPLDAGIRIGGRSVRLRRNYRNGTAILDAATQITVDATTHDNEADDLDPDDLNGGGRGIEEVERGRGQAGTVTRYPAISPADLLRELVTQLRALPHPQAAVVLCPDNATVSYYRREITNAGLATIDLLDYHGIPTPAVKIGTVERAKGLEFKHVFIPGFAHHGHHGTGRGGLADPDRQRQHAVRLKVAMLRARDTLWLGDVQPQPGPEE